TEECAVHPRELDDRILRRRSLDERIDRVAIPGHRIDDLSSQRGSDRVALGLGQMALQDCRRSALAELRLEDRRQGETPALAPRSNLLGAVARSSTGLAAASSSGAWSGGQIAASMPSPASSAASLRTSGRPAGGSLVTAAGFRAARNVSAMSSGMRARAAAAATPIA